MHTIRNFVQLTDNIATSGQPTEAQFSLIAEAGYSTVINLALASHADSLDNEGSLVAGLAMTYCHIPVPFDAPKPHHLRQFFRIMDALEGESIFVHCIMNYRVSAFLYQYLTKIKNMSDDEARSDLFDRWQPDPVWSDLLSWDEKVIGL